jgi:hypothetical protein
MWEVNRMTDSQDKTLRFVYFLLGIALPLAGFAIWAKNSQGNRRSEVDKAHDITVEDSFPASDPPSAW